MSEARIRFAQNKGHTVLYNEVVRDPRLSLKTVGLLVVMKSLINTEWEFSVSGMAKFCRVGKDAIRGCLKELEDAGYLVRERTHNQDGTFSGNEYIIFETSKRPLENETLAGDDEVSHHRRENPTMDKSQRRQKPSSVNPTQIKEITQVQENNIPPISPKGESGKKSTSLTREVRDMLNAYVGQDRELAEEMVALMEVRQSKKAVNSVKAIKTMLNELDRLSGGQRGLKLEIVRQSVTNSWKSVFPVKGAQAVSPLTRQGGPSPRGGWRQ